MILPDTSRLQFDAKKHAYTLDGKLLSGVTSVIDGTSSKQALIQWAANMAIDYVIENGNYVENPIEDNGELIDGGFYQIYAGALEQARTAHTRRKESAGQKGTDTHALVEKYVLDCISRHGGKAGLVMDNDPVYSFAQWAITNGVEFLASEQRLYSETHGLAGTCDFIALINGKLTIGDLKTFPKMWSADAFIQMGAYSLMFKELTGQAPEQSAVVKMCDPSDERLRKYGGKAFATYPRYAIEEDEQMFLKRLDIYRYNQNFVSPKE